MAIEYRCVRCNKLLRVAYQYAGQMAKCPDCGHQMQIPMPGATSTPPPVRPQPARSAHATPRQRAALDQATNHNLAEAQARPKWSYRRRSGKLGNYLEVTNLSLVDLTDVVINVVIHRKDGSTRAFNVSHEQWTWTEGQKVCVNRAFEEEAGWLGGKVAYIETSAQCSLGAMVLDEKVAKEEELAKWNWHPPKPAPSRQAAPVATDKKAETGWGCTGWGWGGWMVPLLALSLIMAHSREAKLKDELERAGPTFSERWQQWQRKDDRLKPPKPFTDNSAGTSWYLKTADGTQHGPVTKETLDLWRTEGRVNASCSLFCTGWTQWKSATEVYPQLTATPPP